MQGVFVSALSMVCITAASNYLIELPISDWLTWGAFTYPFTFFITEVTNYLYGPKNARRVVYIGFVVAVLLSFAFMAQRMALASCLAFLVGQLLDISVFNRLRRAQWWIAPTAASISASVIDTAIFFTIAFASTCPHWIQLALGDFGVKLGMDLLFLLPFRLILWGNRPMFAYPK